MPGPVSVTETAKWPFRAPAAMRTSPASVNLMAFPTRLSSTCVRRCSSPRPTGSDLSTDVVTATDKVPIIFAMGSDPVKAGLVASYNRPGGNVTGVTFFGGLLGAKRLELLQQLVPAVKEIAVLEDPRSLETTTERADLRNAGRSIGAELIILDASSDQDIETAFATFVARRAGALLCGAGAFLHSRRERLVALGARHALPASYALREYVTAGGLMSYGASITDAYRQAGVYAARVLKGERPADLPVVQSTKLELVINVKAARALGLTIPPALLARTDEVIE